MDNYMKKAMEWAHREYRDEDEEKFGYVSGENEPTEAEKIAFELYNDLRDRKGVLDGIDHDILNNMIEQHIDIIESTLS